MLIWIMLVESVSLFSLISGAAVSLICLLFALKFMPLEKIKDVRFWRLVPYLFYLLGQIYLQGFIVIRAILGDIRLEVVDVKTKLTSEMLRGILISSITLTPGTVPVGLEGDTMTVVGLGGKDDGSIQKSLDATRASLEKQLIKAQK